MACGVNLCAWGFKEVTWVTWVTCLHPPCTTMVTVIGVQKVTLLSIYLGSWYITAFPRYLVTWSGGLPVGLPLEAVPTSSWQAAAVAPFPERCLNIEAPWNLGSSLASGRFGLFGSNRGTWTLGHSRKDMKFPICLLTWIPTL